MHRRLDQAIDIGLGAGLMYFFDPERGKRRRKQVVKQAQKQTRLATKTLAQAGQQAQHQVAEIGPAARTAMITMIATDTALLDRAKKELRRQKKAQSRTLAKRAKDIKLPDVTSAASAASVAGSALAARTLFARKQAMDRKLTDKAANEASQMPAGNLLAQATRAIGQRKVMADQKAMAAATGAALAGVAATNGKIADQAKDKLANAVGRAQSKLGDIELPQTHRRASVGFLPVLAVVGALAAIGAIGYFVFGWLQSRQAPFDEDFGQSVLRSNTAAYDAAPQAHDRMQRVASQMQNRTQGAATTAAGMMPSDQELVERIRGELAGVVAHPDAIMVNAQRGIVTLRGPIMADEMPPLLAMVRALPGVESVENQLDVQQGTGRVPDIENRTDNG